MGEHLKLKGCVGVCMMRGWREPDSADVKWKQRIASCGVLGSDLIQPSSTACKASGAPKLALRWRTSGRERLGREQRVRLLVQSLAQTSVTQQDT